MHTYKPNKYLRCKLLKTGFKRKSSPEKNLQNPKPKKPPKTNEDPLPSNTFTHDTVKTVIN